MLREKWNVLNVFYERKQIGLSEYQILVDFMNETSVEGKEIAEQFSLSKYQVSETEDPNRLFRTKITKKNNWTIF